MSPITAPPALHPPSERHPAGPARTGRSGELAHAGIVRIDPPHCGPPGMGNGGWVSGTLAAALPAGPVEVVLRAPTPLDRDLHVDRTGDVARLLDGDVVLAEARPTVALDGTPAPVGLAAARLAVNGFVGWWDHPFPGCFTCGTERAATDALCLRPGPVEGRDGVVAAPWRPTAPAAGNGPHADLRAVWAALDCPTGWVHFRPGGVALLARHAVQVVRPVRLDVDHVVVARRGLADGRKLHATAAVHDADGRLCATARSLWITVP
jgi:hypothetical protein